MEDLEGLTDEELLGAFARAEHGVARRDAAFAELVDRYERRLYAICYRYFGNHADAQDAVQDTFLTVARRADTFRGDSRLSTWLYRVTVNTCNDIARRRDRRPQTPVADVASVADTPTQPVDADEAAGRELAGRVQEALLQLDELSRTLILLVAVEGQPYRVVARALDLPVGTVKSRVHRARARLADLLEAAAREPQEPRRPPT